MNNTLKNLINPFDRLAGWKSFFIGFSIVLATIVIGWQSSICFSGVLDAKSVYQLSLERAFYCQLISLFSLIGVFYVCALIFAREVRFQDIVGTMTLSRFPYLFIALLGFMSSREELALMDEIVASGNINDLMFYMVSNIKLIVLPILMIPFVVWAVILLYNAFKVSTGLRGVKLGVLFTVSLIVAEILSLLLIFTLVI